MKMARFQTRLMVIVGLVLFSICYLYHVKTNYLINPNIQQVAPRTIVEENSVQNSFVCDYSEPLLKNDAKNISHPALHLRDYCLKIPNPMSGWKKAKRYRENDIAFIIYTAFPFYLTRARAVRFTWISRVTNYYFLSSVPDPSLPVTVTNNTGEDYQSNTKKIFYGLEHIYKTQLSIPASSRHKWYFLVGCDTYVNVPHLLKRLDAYDSQIPYFIGGSVGTQTCFHPNGTSYKSLFVGGNTAHVYSAALVNAIYPHLFQYVNLIWPQPNHTSAGQSDVALSCLIFQLGFNMTIIPGFWRNTPDKTIQEFGLTEALSEKEPSSYHYIKPYQMIDLDEFYAYQYVDRLANDRNWNELIHFIRLFITTHYKILRENYRERLEINAHVSQ